MTTAVVAPESSGRVRCPTCGNTLGEYIADQFVMQYRKRIITVWDVAALLTIQCDKCGAVWRPPTTREGQ